MKRFTAGVLLFLLPVALFVGSFGLGVWRSGEALTEEEIVQKIADGEPAFFGLAYRDNRQYYKHLAAGQKAADLLVLGSSRSMQFASDFFATDSFYNAGGGANYVHEYRFFLENLPEESLPETLILVMDQYYFQEGWSSLPSWPELSYDTTPFAPVDTLLRVMQDWAVGKIRLRDLLLPPPDSYGIAAAGRGSGFYPDGSYCYGNLMDHPENGTDVGFADSFDRIARGINRFEWADTVYPDSLAEMGRLMDFCKDHSIQVVGIIPPYAPAVYDRMKESGKYSYLDKLPQALTDLMQPYGFELFDFTHMPDTQDAEYIDGYHGGDRVYARLTLALADQSRILAGQIDTAYLTAALSTEENPLRLAPVP